MLRAILFACLFFSGAWGVVHPRKDGVQLGFLNFITAGIGAATSIFGGMNARRAAGRASDAQVNAARRIGQLGRDTGERTAQDIENATNGAIQNLGETGEFAANDVTAAADRSINRVNDATNQANDVLRSTYDQQRADLDPYTSAGANAIRTLADLAGSNEKFQFSEDDPSYQFRLQQGQQALERSAAARGGLQSGGTLKALTRYAQGVASTEYQAAFDRYMAEKKNRGNMLSTLAGFGSDATGRLVAAGTNYGNNVSRNLTSGAETAGQFDLTGRTTANRFRENAASQGADLRFRGAQAAGNNRFRGTEIEANAIADEGNAVAAGITGRASALNNAIGGVGSAASRLLSDLGRRRSSGGNL